MKLFLHIGLHKTGSTAIQNNFRRMAGGAYLYPSFTSKNHSRPICGLFADDYAPERDSRAFAQEPAEADRDRAFNEAVLDRALRNGRRDVVISGEEISRLAAPAVERMADRFRAHTDEIAVIAYVRDPLEIARSYWQQKIKHGLAELPATVSLNMRSRLSSFISTFGAENLQVYDYGAEVRRHGNILAHFGSLFGLTPRVAPGEGYANTALSADAARMIFLLNRSVPLLSGDPILSRAYGRTVRTLARLYHGRAPLQPQWLSAMADYSDADWMAETFGIRYAPVDSPETTDLVRLLDEIPEPAVDILRGHLAQHYRMGNANWGPRELVSRLYYQHVAEATAWLGNPVVRKVKQGVRSAELMLKRMR